MTIDKKLGKYLRANQNLPAHTRMFTEAPSIVGPKWNTKDDNPNVISFSCVGCFEPIKDLQFKCSSCLWPACSPECIGLITPELHDLECELLKYGKGPKQEGDLMSMKDYYRSDALLPLKIIWLQKKNPDLYRTIMAMEIQDSRRCETDKTKAEERINYILDNFMSSLHEEEAKTGKEIIWKKDAVTFRKIYDILETDSMYLTMSTGTVICALYPTAYLFEHSCIPNCGHNFDMLNGFKIISMSTVPLKAGCHLQINFSNTLWSTQLRQQHMKEYRKVSCLCDRCKDPSELGTNLSTLKCFSFEADSCEGYQQPTAPTAAECEWICNKCPIKITSKHAAILTRQMNEEVQETLTADPDPCRVEELIENLEQFMHPTHYQMFTAKLVLLQQYGSHKSKPIDSLSEECLQSKLDMCNELIRVVRIVDPYQYNIPSVLARLSYEKHNALKEMHRRAPNEDLLDDAKRCLMDAQGALTFEYGSVEGETLTKAVAAALKAL